MIRYAALVICLALVFSHGAIFAQHSHETHGAHAAAPSKQGEKWTPDKPLKNGMEKIKGAIEPLKSTSPRGEYVKASKVIDKQISTIFENCKLDPKADAALHVPLSKIIAASKDLKNSSADTRYRAAQSISHALSEYAELFDHPGF